MHDLKSFAINVIILVIITLLIYSFALQLDIVCLLKYIVCLMQFDADLKLVVFLLLSRPQLRHGLDKKGRSIYLIMT